VTADDQAEHAALYKRASDMLALQAGMLVSLKGPVTLDYNDAAGLYISTGCNILLTEIGPGAAIAYLRQLVADMERGTPAAN